MKNREKRNGYVWRRMTVKSFYVFDTEVGTWIPEYALPNKKERDDLVSDSDFSFLFLRKLFIVILIYIF